MNYAVLNYVIGLRYLISDSWKILELGSRNVNGSVRGLFPNSSKYIGVDLIEGEGVDLVAPACQTDLPDDEFDLVISTEMIEHDPTFWLSLKEAYRVCKSGGYLILTTRGIHYARHDYPSDYYRFTADGLRALMEFSGFECIEAIEHEDTKGVFGYGRKP